MGSPPLGDFEEVWKSQNVKTVVYRYINTTHWRVAREALACALFDIIRVSVPMCMYVCVEPTANLRLRMQLQRSRQCSVARSQAGAGGGMVERRRAEYGPFEEDTSEEQRDTRGG